MPTPSLSFLSYAFIYRRAIVRGTGGVMRRFVWLPLILILSACSGGTSSPTSPTPAAPARPNIQGRWVGEYTIASCTSSGPVFTGFCTTFSQGSVWAITLTLTQNVDQLAGTLTLGDVNIAVTGPINTAGQAFLVGSTAITQGSVVINAAVTNWDTTATTTTMTGGWTVGWTTTAGAGSAQTRNTIRALTKVG